ncbi:hypothetical protein NQ314_008727 [Rhamnusium bicolor]|uniref:Uncharacterized protein n=1 Tax=Rhamnusium bicolor TaxID=1586634 RepID=A0AAV8Y618_9CUCU|nr:hypothetical protein NQ314_008727 [Rhamnusium bicolor]
MDENFLKLFTEYWERLFAPVEMFNEYVLLKLLSIKCESDEPFIKNFAKGIVTFLEQLIAEYSPHVHNKFKPLLKKVLDSIFEKKIDKYLFFYNILRFKTTTSTCILVLDVMDKVDEYGSKDLFKIFNDVIHILEQVKDPIVKIYFKSYKS